MLRRTPMLRAILVLLAVLGLGLATQTVVQTASALPTPFTVRPGADQVEVLDATTLKGSELDLVQNGAVVRKGTVDQQGSLVWRMVKPGSYTVRTTGGTPFTSQTFQVPGFDAPPPAQSFYRAQKLTAGWAGDGKGADSGFNSITTRDGTTLSANVRLPGPPQNGPYPTVVEYSGYDPSNPANTSMSQIFNFLGFAYVGVNIRGTGCSGGSYEPFEPIQSLDGYDAIETVAAQSWAKFHKAGLVGISYPGISELYVARTRPPHLSAITPLSVLDDSYRATLWPGGILNTGFAVPWASQRYQQAKPYGEGWEQGMVDAGYTWCADNQLVRDQNPDPVALITHHPYYNKTYYAQIDPSRFVGRINVPVYLGGAWQDEQTGGHFPDFLDKFTSSPAVYASMSNGGHVESLANLTSFNRYADFLDLYVAHRVPTGDKTFVGPLVSREVTGINGMTMPRGNDYVGMTYRQALHLYSSQKHIRIMFESGAAKGEPSGAPVARFTRGFSAWPIPTRHVARFYLHPGGGLSPTPVRRTHATPRSFRVEPQALPTTDFDPSSGNIWGAHPTYQWKQIPKGTGLGWITSPLRSNVVNIGNASLNVWVRTPAKDVDLEATITDVRPNGTEVYVQSGWLRASHRALIRSRSTATLPVHVDTRASIEPMPAHRYQLLRLEIFPFAQPFRKGDRIRITLDAPGNARPSWAFDTLDHGQRVTVATDRRHQSSLALSVVPVKIPRQAPPCSSLRSQPCRTYPR